MSRTLVQNLYRKLYRRYGPQGWWPTTPLDSPLPVYIPGKKLARLTEQEKFEICLGTFLTQNTSWKNVMLVLAKLKSDGKLSFPSLRRMPAAAMQRTFRSSGYFRQKALRVKNFLALVEKEAGGRFSNFFRGDTGALRKKLLSVNGIGRETADSMLLYAAGRPLFVVDAYTRRVGQRFGILKGDEDYDDIQRIFMDALPPSADLYGEYHALLVRFAKEMCRATPHCGRCPACLLKRGRQKKR